MKTQVLKNKRDFFIFPTSPFHFDGTFHKPSHFPDKLSDWESGKYWQIIRIGKRLFGLKIGYRAKFIKRLSQDFAEGKIDEQKLRDLDQESAKKELLKLYGVGPETARILLFEVCHKYNTFDHIAPWQQKIYSQLFYKKSLVSVGKIQDDIKKQYGEYSMLAVHYIWEDIFWRRNNEKIDWLEKEIRL